MNIFKEEETFRNLLIMLLDAYDLDVNKVIIFPIEPEIFLENLDKSYKADLLNNEISCQFNDSNNLNSWIEMGFTARSSQYIILCDLVACSNNLNEWYYKIDFIDKSVLTDSELHGIKLV